MAGGTAWSGRTLQHVDLDMLVKRPLGVLDLNKFIVPMTEDREDELAQSVALGRRRRLPLDVTQHPAELSYRTTNAQSSPRRRLGRG